MGIGVFYLICIALLNIGSYASKIRQRQENEWNNQGNDQNINGLEKKWVVLVAGSYEWYNYRHQADICHAYQIIRRNGIPAENIITMMVDDIAMHSRNPTRGKIVNYPNGTDVYAGVVIDYKGKDVTVNNFLNIITGNKTGITGGNRKVIESGPNDQIFINFVDHGSTGLLGFPDNVLFADELIDALNVMYKKKSYSKVLLYIEACEAGSMFDGLLPDNRNILAVTASGPRESSWACYCGVQSYPYYTCLGDLFSVVWMEDLDETIYEVSTRTRSIFSDYVDVRYNVDYSNVMIYGDYDIGRKPLSHFIGYPKFNGNKSAKTRSKNSNHKKIVKSSRHINANEIRYEYAKDTMTSQQRQEIENEIINNKKMRIIIDNVFKEIHSLVTKFRPDIKNIIGDFENPEHLNLSMDMFPCYRSIVNRISESCFSIPRNPYSFNRMKIIANLCVADKAIYETAEHFINKACETIPKYIKIKNVH